MDNASREAERRRIASEAPSARVIGFSRNLGFAGAANEGIARTRAPFVLLLNNDAVLAPDYAARLAARLAADERLAAAQGLILAGHGRVIDGAGLAWNARGEAVPALAGQDASAAPREPFEVTGVSATATLYRREALESVAPHGEAFDGSYFAYYEDVDLSLRLARAGWRFVCDPRAVATHEGSLTGRRTPWRRAFWTARNRWRTLFRNFAPSLLARHLGPLLARGPRARPAGGMARRRAAAARLAAAARDGLPRAGGDGPPRSLPGRSRSVVIREIAAIFVSWRDEEELTAAVGGSRGGAPACPALGRSRLAHHRRQRRRRTPPGGKRPLGRRDPGPLARSGRPGQRREPRLRAGGEPGGAPGLGRRPPLPQSRHARRGRALLRNRARVRRAIRPSSRSRRV